MISRSEIDIVGGVTLIDGFRDPEEDKNDEDTVEASTYAVSPVPAKVLLPC